MIPSTTAPSVPPLSPYGTFAGHLFQYGSNRVAFESSLPPAAASIATTTTTTTCTNKCILLGGLSDGLIPVPYTAGLQQVCHDTGWSLVQPILSSSYTGFGHGSLDRDVDEILQLVAYLHEHGNAQRVCFIGHSTGCQDICHLLRRTKQQQQQQQQHDMDDHDESFASIWQDVTLAAAVLQAPVSDRQQTTALDPESYQANLDLATKMCRDGRGDECMPRAAFWAPITAHRFVDLQATDGRDDYFSSDLTNHQLAQRLAVDRQQFPQLKVLVAFSGADEYILPGLDTVTMTQRLAAAIGSNVATPLHLPTANHNLSVGDVSVFLDHVKTLLQRQSGKEEEDDDDE